MNQKVCLLVVLAFLSVGSFAQDEKPDPYGRDLEALTLKKRGPNQDKYSHLFIGYGFVTGTDNDSSEIIYGKSGVFTLGYLFKWRLAKWSELGFDVAYHRTAYHLKQDSAKTVPTPSLHKKEKIIFNSLQTSPFIRIKLLNNYRSNGTFIDLGARTSPVFPNSPVPSVFSTAATSMAARPSSGPTINTNPRSSCSTTCLMTSRGR